MQTMVTHEGYYNILTLKKDQQANKLSLSVLYQPFIIQNIMAKLLYSVIKMVLHLKQNGYNNKNNS